MEKALIKHRNRNAGYHFQLPAFSEAVARASAVPLLNSSIVTILENLTDLLGNIEALGRFRAPSFDELDLSRAGAAFGFGCHFCDKRFLGAVNLFDHIMTVDHRQRKLTKTGKKLLCLRAEAYDQYRRFLFQSHEMAIKNHLLSSSLDRMHDLYFITKKFLSMTSKYLDSLKYLEVSPSTVVAEGIKNLLTQLDSLVKNARCIKSMPEFDAIVDHFTEFKVVFVVKGRMFNEVYAAINHAQSALSFVDRNIYASMSNSFPESKHLAGFPSMGVPNPQHLTFLPSHSDDSSIRGSLQVNIAVNNQQEMANHTDNSTRNFHLIGKADQLPPLNKANGIKSSLINGHVKSFLVKPDLESLIESGNLLVTFDKSSMISGQLVCALKAVAHKVVVKYFGAKVSGIGYEEDFINLYVDDGTKPKTACSVKTLSKELISFFKNHCNEWIIQNTQDAGVRTHLTVKNKRENICCRISFDSELYHSNSDLILYYVKTFPICQKLCYFMQELFKLVDLNFNRYVIIILIIFYLQRRDYLPTVLQLQVNLPKEKHCGPWVINFNKKNPEELKLKPCETDFHKSIKDFFLFYGYQFSFQESVVCPHIGLPINRSAFLLENNCRMPLKPYKDYVEACLAVAGTNKQNVDQMTLTPMCVQDLLELKTNISQPINMEDTEKFVRLCKETYNFYTNNQ